MPYARQEDHRAALKRWKGSNPERVSEHNERWREKNPGYLAAWKAKNPEKVAEYRRKARQNPLRRFDKMGLGRADAKLLLSRKTACAFCGDAGELHLDHILPKSRGGSNRLDNLQWLCVACNAAKGALTTEEFFAHIQKILARRG